MVMLMVVIKGLLNFRMQKGINFTYVTAAGWRASNTRLNFVRPGSDPVGARAWLLWQPGLLR